MGATLFVDIIQDGNIVRDDLDSVTRFEKMESSEGFDNCQQLQVTDLQQSL